MCVCVGYCAANGEVAGAIPDGVFEIFFFIDLILPAAAFNRNEYQESSVGCKGGRCLGLITLPPLCADWKCWESEHSEAPSTYLGLYRESFTFTCTYVQWCLISHTVNATCNFHFSHIIQGWLASANWWSLLHPQHEGCLQGLLPTWGPEQPE
jgi:hypothetical protein